LTNQFQFIQNINWISSKYLPTFYENAVDGISIFFILLTTLVFPLCILSSWCIVDKLNFYSLKLYMVNFLILEFFLINAFTTTNLLLFYVFFESVLIPMMLIIGLWGPGDRKIKANYYFVFYTIAGSSLLLFSIIVIALDFGSFSYINIFEPTNVFILNKRLQLFLWLFFFFVLFRQGSNVPFSYMITRSSCRGSNHWICHTSGTTTETRRLWVYKISPTFPLCV
jgi:NADH-quinone oxidoreductase subunit M